MGAQTNLKIITMNIVSQCTVASQTLSPNISMILVKTSEYMQETGISGFYFISFLEWMQSFLLQCSTDVFRDHIDRWFNSRFFFLPGHLVLDWPMVYVVILGFTIFLTFKQEPLLLFSSFHLHSLLFMALILHAYTCPSFIYSHCSTYYICFSSCLLYQSA